MDLYQVSFELILHAGNAKTDGMLAIEQARSYNFTEANKYVEEAKEELNMAHKSQTSLIQAEANGEKTDLSVLMVHAQDHLTSAMIIIDQAEEFIHIYQILEKLEKGKE